MKQSILHIIQQNAIAFPGRICLVYEEDQCTYEELAGRINEAITQLQKLGIEKNKHRVYLSGNNSIDLIVLFLSLIALEADIVLVDPKSTKKEIEQLMISLPPGFLLLEDEIYRKDFQSKENINVYSMSFQCIPVSTAYQNNRSAFITFFSTGSTGEPKAFGFSEEKLMKQVLNLASHCSWNAQDKVLCPVSFTHSHGVMMSLPFLLLGAAVHYLHPKNCQPGKIIQHILQQHITIITGVPFQYNMMLEEEADQVALKTLRYAFCGSAPMTEHLAVNFERKFGVRLHQAYGISEIGPVCVNLFEEGINNFQSVGKVIRNIEYKITDDRDDPVKPGEEGELLVRAEFMTEGYLNVGNEQLFRNGWMCTQDIVREDKYGNIFIIGRKSNFINISGYKVYPVEVEKVLLSMKGIKDAIVVGEEDALRTQVIKAYVSTFYPVSEDAIKEYCKQHLSKFKIPHRIILTDELPTNSIGKVITSKLKG